VSTVHFIYYAVILIYKCVLSIYKCVLSIYKFVLLMYDAYRVDDVLNRHRALPENGHVHAHPRAI
jgi:hypothetical protein